MKKKLADRIKILPESLPFNREVIQYIKEERNKKREVILATASHIKYAKEIANYLQIFDQTLATEHNFNLSSHNKAQKLIGLYGYQGYDYIGDHDRDMPVWKSANQSILVQRSQKYLSRLSKKIYFTKILYPTISNSM